mgnify:CR=1 FL=1
MAIINFNSISGINTISVASSITVGSGVTITATSITAPTFTGNVNATGISTFSGGINVGNTFIRSTSIGIGTTNTSGRNAGVSTAQGTLIFNSDTGTVQVYNGSVWRDVGKEAINATGGLKIGRAHV